MATKNFGLAGIGADVQFGKGNGRLVAGEGVFRFTSDGSALVNARVAAPRAGATGAEDAANRTYVDDGLAPKLDAADYTAADVLAKLITVDGAGSGLDADLLDGQDGAYYLAWANLTGKPTNLNGYGLLAEADGRYINAASDNMTGELGMGNNKITGLATPTAATDASTKAYVDSVASGLDVKAAARAATTGDITLSGEQTVDGVSVVTGDRVLVKNQNAPAQNGIYVVAAGAWIRASDFDESGEITGGEFVFVKEGSTQADTGWVVAVPNAELGTIGVDPIQFVQFSAAGIIQAGDGLTQTGNVFNVVGTAGRIVANADSIDLATTAVSAGSYGAAGSVATFTVDEYGRLTAAATTAIAITASQVTDFTAAAETAIDGHLSGSTSGAGVDVSYVAGAISANLDFVSLTAESAIADADLLAFYDDTAAAYRKITAAQLKTYAQSGLSQNQIVQGDSSVVVSDTGTGGSITITADNSVSATFTASGLSARSLAANNLTAGHVLYAGASGAITGEAGFEYNATTNTLAVTNVDATQLDGGNISISGNTISSTDTNGNINLTPNGSGQVVIGGAGAGQIATDTGEDLNIFSGGDLALAGDTITLDVGTNGAASYVGNAATISATIASGNANLIPNKQYVLDTVDALTAGDGLTKTGSTFNVVTADASRIVVNADSIDLATVTQGSTGNFVKVDIDSYGRVIGNTAVTGADVRGTSAYSTASGELTLDVNGVFGLADVGTAVSDSFVKVTTNAKGQVSATSAVTGADVRGTNAYAGTTNEITLNGITGAFGLADVTNSGTGSFVKITRDAKGRVTGTAAVVAADITGLVDSVYINAAGDTMTGSLILNADPTVALGAATKQYVDNAASASLSGVISTRTVAVPLTSLGSVNIGAVLPTGATVVRVLVNVATASDAATTLAILSGSTTVMATSENDVESAGLYVADAYHAGGGEQLTAVVGGSVGSTGTANVIVEYRNA